MTSEYTQLIDMKRPYHDVKMSEELIQHATDSIQEEEDATRKRSIGEWIDGLHFGLFYIILTVGLFFGNISEATTVLLASFISRAVRCEWELSRIDLALLTASIFIGYLVGCSLWGFLSDRYGRRCVVLISLLMIAYYSLLSGLAPSYIWAIGLRFVIGLSVAGITNAAVYFVEVIPSRFRAPIFLLTLVFWSIGTIIEAGVAMALLPRPNGWRILTISTAVMPVMLALVVYMFPESPRFLAVTGEKKLAYKAILQLSRLNRNPAPDENQIELTIERPKTASLKRLFNKKTRNVTFLSSITGFSVGFLYFGLTIYTVELIERIGFIKPVESDSCTEACSMLTHRDYFLVMITSSAELPGALLAVILTPFMSRKWVIIIFSIITTVMTLILMVESQLRWVNIMLLFLSRGAGMLLFNTFNLYILEIYPTSVRAMGYATVSVFIRLGSIFTPIMAQVVMPHHRRIALSFYAFSALLTAILVFLLKVDVSDEELQDSAR